MDERTNNHLQGNKEPEHAKESRGTAARLTDDARGPKKGSPRGRASPNPRGDKIVKELVANVGKNPTPSSTLVMADLTNNLSGNLVPLHAEVTRTSEEHRAIYARGSKNGNERGLVSSKPWGDIANKPAMADLTHNLTGNQVPLHPKETRARREHRAVYAHGPKNGNNQGLLLPKPSGTQIANKFTTNKKMDDRVKNGKQLNAERLGAVLARLEQKRAWGKPPPKRGDVKKVIVEAGVKKVIDTGKAFCCASGPFDVDAFVGDLPFPTRSEPTATLWAKVEV